jgi:hypothetical protein
MKKICARCGKPITMMDVLTYAPGEFAKHAIFCPPGWRDLWVTGATFREALANLLTK